MKVFGVVYLIVNLFNGKMYVGQTIQPLKKRFYDHCYANSAIGNAIRKYKPKNFRCEILKRCATKAELDAWEKFFIAALRCKAPNGYNLTDGGEGAVGLKRTPEHCAKLSAAQSGEKNHNYGKQLSPETRTKMSKAHIGNKNRAGKPQSAASRAKIANALKGKKRPPEVGRKISATKKGKPFSAKHCISLSVAKRGKSPYKNLTAELDAHQLSYAMLAQLLGN